MSSAPKIPCPHCKGKGRIPLAPEYAQTLRHFKGKQVLTAQQLSELDPAIAPTANNQRLKRLMAAGFLKRTRSGKRWMYFRHAR